MLSFDQSPRPTWGTSRGLVSRRYGIRLPRSSGAIGVRCAGAPRALGCEAGVHSEELGRPSSPRACGWLRLRWRTLRLVVCLSPQALGLLRGRSSGPARSASTREPLENTASLKASGFCGTSELRILCLRGSVPPSLRSPTSEAPTQTRSLGSEAGVHSEELGRPSPRACGWTRSPPAKAISCQQNLSHPLIPMRQDKLIINHPRMILADALDGGGLAG